MLGVRIFRLVLLRHEVKLAPSWHVGQLPNLKIFRLRLGNITGRKNALGAGRHYRLVEPAPKEFGLSAAPNIGPL
jgi:hypothetical protein